jgi:polyisoprenoid-binding protein YceI
VREEEVSEKRNVTVLAGASAVVLLAAGMLFGGGWVPLMAQAQAPAQGRGPAAAAPAAAGPVTLEVAPGTRASYRVREQFVGIDFPNDASGSTDTVTGTLHINADGSEDMRDNYLRTRTFETEKFPTVEFVPRRIEGVPSPVPVSGQAGFQLIGDMTVRGVKSEVTWKGVATFSAQQVAGRAITDFDFAKFSLAKPSIGRLMGVDDKIQLELEFRMKRS